MQSEECVSLQALAWSVASKPFMHLEGATTPLSPSGSARQEAGGVLFSPCYFQRPPHFVSYFRGSLTTFVDHEIRSRFCNPLWSLGGVPNFMQFCSSLIYSKTALVYSSLSSRSGLKHEKRGEKKILNEDQVQKPLMFQNSAGGILLDAVLNPGELRALLILRSVGQLLRGGHSPHPPPP